MPKSLNYKSRGAAFTLIELLVVIGIIGVLAAGAGVILKGNNPATALRGGQSTLVSMLSAARGQSALNQVNAMIIVDSDKSSATFLRSVRVVVEKTAGVWTEVGGEVILPQGVYVVPRDNSMSGYVTLKNSSRVSDFFIDNKSVPGVTASASTFLWSKQFTSLGAISVATGGKLLVAAGSLTGSELYTIDNDAAVRGLVISKYGVATLVNESESL